MGALRATRPRPRGRPLSSAPWRIERRHGTPAQLHSWSSVAPVPAGRLVRVCEALSPAVVLGSTQSPLVVDADRAAARGVEVVRRRSGGGAVLVEPGAQLWVDVYLPRGDPLFSDDVSLSFLWLGKCWAGAVRAASPETPSPAVLARNPTHPLLLARSLCFVGAVAGEVVAGGRKVVGLSQRRHRAGAWFHSMALLELDPEALPSLLAWPAQEQAEGAAELGRRAAALAGGRGVARRLERELVERLQAL